MALPPSAEGDQEEKAAEQPVEGNEDLQSSVPVETDGFGNMEPGLYIP